MVRPSAAPQYKGLQNERKNEYLKKIDFLRQTNLKLFMERLRLFLKFIISITDGHCDYSFRAPKNVATPLHTLFLK